MDDKPLAGTAALCIHGFGGEPFEMLGLASALEALGCTVRTPLLPGHGETPEAWDRTGFDDWAGAVEREYDILAAEYEQVMACGLSLGGTLSLHLAQVRTPVCVATMAAPVYLYRFYPPEATDWRLPFIGIMKYFKPMWPKGEPNPESRRIAPWQGYDRVNSLNALHSLLKGIRRVRRALPSIETPLLAIHAHGDRTVPESNAQAIVERVSSRVAELEYLDIEETVTGHHVITTHQETRKRVEASVVAFALRNLKAY